MGDFFYLCSIPIIRKEMLTEYIKDILGFKDLEVKLIDDKYVITQTLDCEGRQAIYDFYKSTNNLVTKILYDRLAIYIPREMYIIKIKTINEPIPE
jgi:hypothetical protein